MTLQNLRYIISIAETGSITEASKRLFISQPSLSNAVKEVEKEIHFPIFTRTSRGITVTAKGLEFIGYARQVIQQMNVLQDTYITMRPQKTYFSVSTQHYVFATNAFVDMIRKYGQERYEFCLNETQTYQILENVKNHISELGIIYLSNTNEIVIRRTLEDMHLEFRPLFTVKPHVALYINHPLADHTSLRLIDLIEYPRLKFLQGNYESSFFSEELYSSLPVDKEIRVSDRAAMINMMIGLNGYSISTGIFPKYMQGDAIKGIPLHEKERMTVGYVVNAGQTLSDLGTTYIRALEQYQHSENIT
jgi:DNA-binding transcriptional LysR family regulator